MEHLTEKGYEHLRADIKPIVTCVGDYHSFDDEPGPTWALSYKLENVERYEKDPNILYVSFFADPDKLDAQHIKHGYGTLTYALSPIDSRDKFSKEFLDCIGLIVSGKEKQTGEEISFLGHLEPNHFLVDEEGRSEFLGHLQEQLDEMITRAEPGTIDAVFFAGKYLDEVSKIDGRNYRENYDQAIAFLTSEISTILGFEPVVSVEPKKDYGQDDAYYSTQTRRLYMMGPTPRANIHEKK